MIGPGDGEQRRHVFGGLQTPAVEVVVGRQGVHGRVRRIDAILPQPRLEPRQKIAARVVSGDDARVAHRPLLPAEPAADAPQAALPGAPSGR